MPIRINLLAEQLDEEDLRRRDPAKRAIWIAAGVVGVVMLLAGWMQWRIMKANKEARAMQQQWQEKEPQYNALAAKLKDSTGIEARLESLFQLSTNRFLASNALDALQKLDMTDLQLTQIRSVHDFEFIDVVKEIRDGQGNTTRKGKPATAVERIKLVIEGRDYSSGSDERASDYAARLEQDPYFKSVLQANGVQLNPLSVPLQDVDNPSRTFRTFSIECVFPAKVN